MASIFVTLLIWAAGFAALEWQMRNLYAPPGDWIGALIASFFIALGAGALRKARLDRRDASLIANIGGELRDGQRVAVAGTIQALGAALDAPFTGTTCVAYEYEISHPEMRRQTTGVDTVIDRAGVALAPAVVRGAGPDVRLMAYPGMDAFSWTRVDDHDLVRRYIAGTRFEPGRIAEAVALLCDRMDSVRKDWKETDSDVTPASTVRERAIPAGSNVCLIGCYSARDNAIVPKANSGGVRAIPGDPGEAKQYMRIARGLDLAFAVFFLVVPALTTWGILTYRENYFDRVGRGSLRLQLREAFFEAAHAGKVDELHTLLGRGVDPNARDEDGATALSYAPTAAEASLLLDAGADANIANRDGFTPLMAAARSGEADIVALLIRRGAAMDRRDRRQRTALTYALNNNAAEAAKVLQDAGAVP